MITFSFIWGPCVSGWLRREAEEGEEDVGERADGKRVGERPDTDGPAERPPARENQQFDAGPRYPYRQATRRQADHQPVAWARPQTGADVETGSHGIGEDADQQVRPPAERAGHDGQHLQCQGQRDADQRRVRDRPDAGALAQRHPKA
jgi:hypothetical protein